MTGDIRPGDIQPDMRAKDFPLYVTDDGIVQCAHQDCDPPHMFAAIGRRTTVDKLLEAIDHHAYVDHFLLLDWQDS